MRTKVTIRNDKHLQINNDCGLSSCPFAVFCSKCEFSECKSNQTAGSMSTGTNVTNATMGGNVTGGNLTSPINMTSP
jgi:hypothetical protein